MMVIGLIIRALISLTALGWFLILRKYLNRISSYHEKKAYSFQINLLLPNAIEVIALYLSIGLDLCESIRRAASSVPEPMGSELAIIAKDLFLGMSVSEVMNSFTQRTQCTSGRALTLVFDQAGRFGNETASKLKELAGSLRDRRVSTLERATKTAPVKLLLPMVLFVFPALLIILFTPVFIRSGLLN